MDNSPIKQELIDRRRWFDVQWPILETTYSPFRFITRIFPLEVKFLRTCPCCGYPTIEQRNWWEICQICWWEDDGQDDGDADKVMGGPNYDLSLTKARENFASNNISFNIADDRFNRIGERTYDYRQQIITAFHNLQISWAKENKAEAKKHFMLVKILLKNASKQL